MTTTARDGQTLADIAIQEYGTLEALLPLAEAAATTLTAQPPAGTILPLPELHSPRHLQQWIKAQALSPATAPAADSPDSRLFTQAFNPAFA